MALFASGISTFIQCRRIGPIITAGLAGGLPLIFEACIAAAPIEIEDKTE